MADIIRLTEALESQSSFRLYTKPIESSQGLSISFDFYAYDGTGADGLSFFFIDGSQSPQSSGGFGGSLGYAPLDAGGGTPGLVGGWLGVGFDGFGFNSEPTQGRVGGTTFTPDSIVLRASQQQNYRYIAGTPSLNPGLDVPRGETGQVVTREEAKRRAQVDLSPDGKLFVRVDLNNDGDFDDTGEFAFNGLDVKTENGGFVPSTFKFGFAASTGALTNIHEIGNFQVKTFAGVVIPGDFATQLAVIGTDGDDTQQGTDQADIIKTGSGNDSLLGGSGNDVLAGGAGSDGLTGGGGADIFEFEGTSKAQALRSSTLKSIDRITDFRFAEGDRFRLDFDDNDATVELPRKLFNAGRERGNLQAAARSAYADKDQRKRGNQGLKANEAVFFRLGSRTYLSVNDDKAGFNANNDLLVDVGRIGLKSGDAGKGVLNVRDYFV